MARRSSGELEVPRRRRALRRPRRAASISLRVPLAVADGQRVQREALALRDRRGGVGIEAPAQEHDGIGASVRSVIIVPPASVRHPPCVR